MKRPLVAFVLVLAAAFAQAEAQSDPLGPRSEPTTTVAAAVARTQIEKSGYTSVRGLQRASDGTWRAVARDAKNAPVAIVLDSQGKVNPTR
jgi:hypothetical protein